MIIGNGLLASVFKENDKDDIIFFASGVSNSSETAIDQFKREENLVYNTAIENKDHLFVYFSTCSIYDSSKTNSPYVLHKLHMEEIIKTHCKNHLILRVSNAVGKGGNPNLLLNYIMSAIANKQQINVHTKATRNIIDADDIKNITLDLIESKVYNRIVNIAYPYNFSIIEIIEIIERYREISIDIHLIKSGENYNISIPDIENYFTNNNITDKEKYLCNIINKYYA